MGSESLIVARKQPKQRRSQDTVDVILEATAHILQEEGYDKASTNRVARRAGVSIGSLYQYFPNKESLVRALFQRHHEEMIALLQTATMEMLHEPIQVAVRAYVRAMLEAHAVNPRLHKALVQQVLHLGWEYLRELLDIACQIVETYLAQHREKILPQNLKMAAFVLVSSVESVTHTAILEAQDTLDIELLEAELCDLILRYLLGESGTAVSL